MQCSVPSTRLAIGNLLAIDDVGVEVRLTCGWVNQGIREV